MYVLIEASDADGFDIILHPGVTVREVARGLSPACVFVAAAHNAVLAGDPPTDDDDQDDDPNGTDVYTPDAEPEPVLRFRRPG